jgi:hypothetical protein
MPTNYTPQLGLSLPTQGELTGTWGDVTNTSMTGLVDTAIAGTTTLSTDVDVTLTATVGTANQARSAILLCNGARTGVRNLTAPATSKVYTVVNATTGGFAVVLRGVGPTAGVSIAAGKVVNAMWNGADFVVVGASAAGLDGVVSITNGGTGQTTAAAALTALGGAPIASPTFTGNPQAPTPTPGDNDTSVATTAFVTGGIATAVAPLAPTSSPTLTGVPTAPTAAPGTNTTQIATTAFGFANFAPISSPAFTGVPTAPTAAYGTNTVQVATMAAVQAAVGTLPAGALPSVAGRQGQFLGNDGVSNVSWQFVSQDIAFYASGIV